MVMKSKPNRALHPVPFTAVTMEDGFWSRRLHTVKAATLSACLHQCETAGRIDNFAKAAGRMEGSFKGIYFDDSDVYKVLEGAAYSLMTWPDPELEARVDRIIVWIAAAQEEDGYLCTYFTLEEPDRKWKDMEKHEMYCGGHLMEAAVAYARATGKRKLLEVACKVADHYDTVFGPGKKHWVTGHEEVELALVKLFQETGKSRYWKLALWLLEERGHGHGKGMIWEREDWGPAYCQDDVPVSEMDRVKGHAVRAMYLYAAMADVAAMTGNRAYESALNRVWAHVTERNMYITGGIGPSAENEGFTEDYDLPNATAYCETCASIGMVFWNHRMNLLHGDSKYADIVELALYNGVLSGISLDGDKFFYVNPLASEGDHHRVPWYDVSCCPTNLVRLLPSIGDYLFAVSDEGIAVNQYVQCCAKVEREEGSVKLSQETQYPWDGKVTVRIVSVEGRGTFALKLRRPGWCRSASLHLNGKPAAAMVNQGYWTLQRAWTDGDEVTLVMDMPAERVYAHPLVNANEGRVALQRGPLVYCMEQADHPGIALDGIQLTDTSVFMAEHRSDLLGGVTVLIGQDAENRPIQAIPYCVWDNRSPGWMQVWHREAETPLVLYRRGK